MEYTIITAILTAGAVVISWLISKNLIKFRETSTEDLTRQLKNAQNRANYYKGKAKKLEEPLEDFDLEDIEDLADLDQIVPAPFRGIAKRWLSDPDNIEKAKAFLQGLSTKKGPDQEQTKFLS